jgi:predicted Zn-dependent protease
MLTRTRHLPLYLGLTAFVLYACTMGGGLTLNGLPLASKLAGWNDAPMIGQPLLWLCTLPLHWLPAAALAQALKIFAAALAGLILGLLVRTVQLLPWDYPWDKVSLWACLLPGLAAAALCGLEFNFWQEATSTCGELLDLLILATAIWLLVEYHIRRQARWLETAVVVWGIGMAENWVMLVTLPLFVLAVIRLEGIAFFRRSFVLRLAVLGLAGFAIYAVQPMANGLLPHSPWTLSQSWLASLHQTNFILHLYLFWRTKRLMLIGVAVYFLLPTLPLLVRMKDEGTDNKPNVDQFQTWLYRALRMGLLAACCWLAFDPTPGPRHIVQKQLGTQMPLLTFDYLDALGASFLLGNLLLMVRPARNNDWYGPVGPLPWRRFVVPAATAGMAIIVLGLFLRNLSAVSHLNFHPLEQFGDTAVDSLPAGGGVVLSDLTDRTAILQAALARRHRTQDWLAVDTRALPTVAYRAQLERRQPAGWLTSVNQHELNAIEVLRLLEAVAHTHRIFYLNPSHSQILEEFYLEPTGTVYELKLRNRAQIFRPPASAASWAANEQFWTGLWDRELAAFVPAVHPPPWQRTLAHWGITPAPREQDRWLAEWYSIPLDAWAVTLQQQGHWPEAAARFQQALLLNDNNASARMSLSCNTNLQAGRPMNIVSGDTLATLLNAPNRMDFILLNGGPFDEPNMCDVLGCLLMDRGQLVQAAEQLERAHQLATNSLAPELLLADVYNRLRMPERSQPLIRQLRATTAAATNSSLELNLALLESYAWLLQTNQANARQVLGTVLKAHPDDPQVVKRVLAAYLAFNDITNALQLVDERLAKSPDDVSSMNAKAVILVQTGHAAEALPLLDHALTLTNQVAARINRAYARLETKDFAGAKSDLTELVTNGNDSGMVEFGLALVAEHGQDTNTARQYLGQCLSNTPASDALWKQAYAHWQRLATNR